MRLLQLLSRTGQKLARNVKALLLHQLWKMGFRHCCRHAPIYMLTRQLRIWNKRRTAKNGGQSAITLDDLQSLRQLIDLTGSACGLPARHVLLDQCFFMAVGAISQPVRNDQHWELLDQSIHQQLSNNQSTRVLLLGILVIFSMTWGYMQSVERTKPAAESTMAASILDTGGTADPVTISLLQLVYQKMRNGTCQLPQAAMLPEMQREAFIMFVTEGAVDVDHVEDLRKALGYVNCLYPQELMRPQRY